MREGFTLPPHLREHLVAIGALSIVLALFFSPAIFTGQQFLLRDSGRMHGPVKRWVAAELRKGRLPEWNPYAGLGAPVVAGAVDAVQHPFSLLLVSLPFHVAFKGWILLSYLMAAAGCYAWARRLGRGLEASLVAGISFALGGYLVSASENPTYLTTLAAVPWLFAAAHGWLWRGGAGRLALLGLASFLCAASGDVQAWGFACGALPLYALALVEDGRPVRIRFARGLGALGAALMAAAPAVLPVIAWLPYSSRVDLGREELLRWSLPWPRLAELFVPHVFRVHDGALFSPVHVVYGDPRTPTPWVLSVYVGAATVLLAALGAASSRRARWLVAGAAAATWMALGWNAGFGQLASRLPVLSGFRYWEKMAAWPSLLLAAAAAFGLERLVAEPRRPRRLAPAVGALGLAVLGAGALAAALPEAATSLLQRGEARYAAEQLVSNLRDGLVGAGGALVALALAAVALARGRLGRAAPGLLVLVVLLDLVAANARGYVLASPELVRPVSQLGRHLQGRPGLQRVVPSPFSTDLAGRWLELRHFERAQRWFALTLEPAFCMDFGIGNFEPYVGMVPDRISRFRRRLPLAKQLPNLGMWSVGWLVVPGSPRLAAEANLAPPFEPAAVEPLVPAYLLPVPHRERAYLARRLEAVDRRAAMEFVLDPASSLSDRSVVEGLVPADYAVPRGSARIVADEPQRVEVETRSDRGALLVLNDTLAPGWAAAVDGRPAEILPANYLARGVWVDAGTHTVSFRYRTPGLREGWAILGAGALALGGWGLWRRRSGRIRYRSPPMPNFASR